MQNKEIKRIYDDAFMNQIQKNEFFSCLFIKKTQDYKPDNNISNDIFEGKDLRSLKRTELNSNYIL